MANATIITQFEMLTGALKAVTNYSPKVKTVKITSDNLSGGRQANRPINVIACSIKHTPWGGNGTIKGVWSVDQLVTHNFTIATNPLTLGQMGVGTTSTFTFNASTMIDGDQVYTHHVPLGESGKLFELELTQTGSQRFDVLGLDLEVGIEDRRPAYLGGGF